MINLKDMSFAFWGLGYRALVYVVHGPMYAAVVMDGRGGCCHFTWNIINLRCVFAFAFCLCLCWLWLVMPPTRLSSTHVKSCGFDLAFFMKNRESKPIHRLLAQFSLTFDLSCGFDKDRGYSQLESTLAASQAKNFYIIMFLLPQFHCKQVLPQTVLT